jgi:hypothetical protein
MIWLTVGGRNSVQGTKNISKIDHGSHGEIAVVSFGTQPDDDGLCPTVDLVHLANLGSFFQPVGLVDAYRINPNGQFIHQKPNSQSSQSLKGTFRDKKFMAIAVDNSSFGIRNPYVRESVELGVFVNGRINQAALGDTIDINVN